MRRLRALGLDWPAPALFVWWFTVHAAGRPFLRCQAPCSSDDGLAQVLRMGRVR